MNTDKEKSPRARLLPQEKANLRAGLPDLLERASSNPEVAQEALQVCLKLRHSVPPVLLTKDNIAKSFSLQEVINSLERFSVSELSLDMSAGLAAIKVLAAERLQEATKRRLVVTVTKVVTSKLKKIADGTSKKTKRSGLKINQTLSNNRFTDSTLSAVADLALWVLSSTSDKKSKTHRFIYTVAIQWVQSVENIWRKSSSLAAISCAVKFLRSLERLLPISVYAELKAEPSVMGFRRDMESALIQKASHALLDGRFRDLENIFATVKADNELRERLQSELREICRSRPSDIFPEAIEWVARHVETGSGSTTPIPADESQSPALDYISVCLLAAWDASSEGERSAHALENIKKLARDLFKVDLTGIPGEVVDYDERQHELRPTAIPIPQRVEFVRPAVRWSDGIRTRFLARAVVKLTSR